MKKTGLDWPKTRKQKDSFKLLRRKIKREMNTPLRSFQYRGVWALERLKGRGLLASDMGVGKTIQALAWIKLHPELRPAIIVCPASGKLHWAREARVHASLESRVLSGQKPHRIAPTGLYIVNFDILKYWSAEIAAIAPQIMIIDEVHRCKGRKTDRTKACKELSKAIPHVIGLSGTPMVNRPVELFPVLNMLNPKSFSSFWKFATHFCDAKKGFRGWDFNGASNLKELHELLTYTIMVRVLKKDVLDELPKKIRSVIPLPIDNSKEYWEASTNFLSWLKKKSPKKAKKAKAAQALVQIGYLKRLAAAGKMKAAMEWIDDYLESGKKLVVFAHHKNIIAELSKKYGGKAVVYTGSTSLKKKEWAEQSFQCNPNVRLFLGNMQSAGEVITLTAADSTCFVELGWSPGLHTQCEDRVYRIGQTSDSVNAYYLISEGTIEEEICELIQKKQEVLEQVLDGKFDGEDMDWDVYHKLIDALKRRAA